MESFVRRCRCIALAGAAMSCAADNGEPEIGTPVASGRYIDLWASAELEVCGGTLVRERYIAVASRLRHAKRPPALRVPPANPSVDSCWAWVIA